jgi:hypothetical protein
MSEATDEQPAPMFVKFDYVDDVNDAVAQAVLSASSGSASRDRADQKEQAP